MPNVGITCTNLFFFQIVGTNGSANHPCGYSVHPVSQPPGIVPHNTPQHMAGGFQMIGKLSSTSFCACIINFHVQDFLVLVVLAI